MKIKTAPSPFTPAQIVQCLIAVGFEPLPSEDQLASFDPSLENLEKIVRGHVIAFPFENFSMHYSKEHEVDITPQGVFNRIIASGKGLGSYCFGLNTAIKCVLQGLGYGVASGSARTNMSNGNDPPRFTVLNHMFLFVTTSTSDQIYLVDVGAGAIFGTSGPVRPIPLIPDLVVPGSAPGEEHRISYGSIHPNAQLDGLSGEYSFQTRLLNREWRTTYQFSLAEYFHEDYEVQSYYICNSPKGEGILRDKVICVKFYEVDKGGALGRYVLNGNTVTKAIGAEKFEVKKLQNEKERIEALKEYFGVTLEADALENIQGRAPFLIQ